MRNKKLNWIIIIIVIIIFIIIVLIPISSVADKPMEASC